MKKNPISFLKNETQTLLLQQGRVIKLRKNASLFSQGQPAESFYVVLSGALKLKKNPEKALLDLAGPGELVGAGVMKFAAKSPCYPITAKALGATEVLKLSKDFFSQSWEQDSELLAYVDHQVIRRLHRIQNDRRIQRFTLEAKVAYFLTEKVAPLGQLKITRQDIANGVGASTEAVIRLMSKWSRDHLISTAKQEISIFNLDALKAFWLTT
ncbi:MAG: Crp/Fnr family transcriptional regulator [Bdellovibrionales bacterium]|nr:Crp/Fnr family transcriptional regulator [Bdellovibrionales bacterium]